MPPLALLTFFALMVSLAALPSASVALVVTRSATLGFRNGAAVAAGIVAADLIFASLAIFGMVSLAQTFGGVFALMRYAAGAYLIWIGIGLIRAGQTTPATPAATGAATLAKSFLAGLFLTFGDLKAILFYASLFPTLFDLTRFGRTDYLLILAITTITVGGVKLGYALLARTLVERWKSTRVTRPVKTIAGSVLIGTGGYVILKS
ncbi:LysE family translocator [Synoicihabitans lomoniglobus]|uniref:LysE family translocator n=1 Tax=Synoicihabitans lomoniglobus TaxID=2909285 RepID=A0AAF0I502_9BACT|nr:LysE family translocator [Opitutaceae bacterium LMO-M01]WED67108.1 LysE family translocator [Opitutaceae bacterium LMO-M01]